MGTNLTIGDSIFKFLNKPFDYFKNRKMTKKQELYNFRGIMQVFEIAFNVDKYPNCNENIDKIFIRKFKRFLFEIQQAQFISFLYPTCKNLLKTFEKYINEHSKSNREKVKEAYKCVENAYEYHYGKLHI